MGFLWSENFSIFVWPVFGQNYICLEKFDWLAARLKESALENLALRKPLAVMKRQCPQHRSLRYPTFFKGKNYAGNPDPLNNRFLREMIDTILRREVQQLRDAVFVLLRDTVPSVFEYLGVKDKRVLYGLLHPSGANRERVNYFLGKKPRELLSPRTNPDKIDAAKRRLRGKVRELLSTVSVQQSQNDAHHRLA